MKTLKSILKTTGKILGSVFAVYALNLGYGVYRESSLPHNPKIERLNYLWHQEFPINRELFDMDRMLQHVDSSYLCFNTDRFTPYCVEPSSLNLNIKSNLIERIKILKEKSEILNHEQLKLEQDEEVIDYKKKYHKIICETLLTPLYPCD